MRKCLRGRFGILGTLGGFKLQVSMGRFRRDVTLHNEAASIPEFDTACQNLAGGGSIRCCQLVLKDVVWRNSCAGMTPAFFLLFVLLAFVCFRSTFCCKHVALRLEGP